MKEVKCYTPTGFGQYAEGLGTLRASGGDYGGVQKCLWFHTDSSTNKKLVALDLKKKPPQRFPYVKTGVAF